MLTIKDNEPLTLHTTLKAGGFARYLVAVNDVVEVKEAIQFAKERNLSLFVLGGGSNVLFSDKNFEAVVVKNNLKGKEVVASIDNFIYLKVASGEVLDETVIFAVENNYFGLENLSAIPGTVGATPVQNVGAYGVEVAELIHEVEVLDLETNEIKIFTNSDCQFTYRDSIFKKNPNSFFITAVTYKLSTVPSFRIDYPDLKKYFSVNEPQRVEEVREAVMAIRDTKFPDWKVVGTAGSFFKNPLVSKEKAEELKTKYPDLPSYIQPTGDYKISLGFVLDKICNLKGFSQGKVLLSSKQALVLINCGEASSIEIKNFSQLVIDRVHQETGILIEREVQLVNF